MVLEGEVWRLYEGDRPLGELTVTELDFPAVRGVFRATEAFAAWQPVFNEASRLADDLEDDEQIERFDAIQRRLNDALSLHDAAGQPVAEFLLYIDGQAAGWRWVDG